MLSSREPAKAGLSLAPKCMFFLLAFFLSSSKVKGDEEGCLKEKVMVTHHVMFDIEIGGKYTLLIHTGWGISSKT